MSQTTTSTSPANKAAPLTAEETAAAAAAAAHKAAQQALREMVQVAIDCIDDAAKAPTIANLSAAMDAMSLLKDGERGVSITLTDKEGRPATRDSKGWYSFLAGQDPSRSGIIRHNRSKKSKA